MIGAVIERRLEVDHREARQHTVIDRALEAFFNAGDVFLRHRAADHVVLELVAGAGRHRLEADLDAGVLARAASLLLVGIVDLGNTRDGLAIGHLRRADIGLDLELALHAVDDDLEMELAHPLDDGLAAFMIDRNPERGILGRESRQGLAHFFLVALGLGLDRDLDDRIGKFHALQHHRVVGVAQRVAGGGVLEAGESHDVAGARLFDVFAMIGMHQQHAADALAVILDRIQHHRARHQHARIDAHEGERADEGIGHDLEGESGEGLVVGGLADDDFLGSHLHAIDGGDVGRRRQEIDHAVEQRLHALVLEGRAAQHRHEGVIDRALADAALQRRDIRLLAGEIGFERGIVLLHRELDQRRARLGGGLGHVGRNLDEIEFGAERFILPNHRLHQHQINDALEFALDADRQLRDQRHGTKPVLDHLDGAGVIGADAVHLVDEADARHAVFVGLAPDRLGLRLHARHRIEHRDRAVKDAKRALDLDGEIDVARRVNDVDAVVVPEAGRRGRGDGDAALLLLLHPIHGRGAVMHFADFMRPAGVIKNALSRRRLAGIDVSHDADIAITIEGRNACHFFLSLAPKAFIVRRPTSGNARRLYSHPPYGACLRAS